jgi:hypothetical protein
MASCFGRSTFGILLESSIDQLCRVSNSLCVIINLGINWSLVCLAIVICIATTRTSDTSSLLGCCLGRGGNCHFILVRGKTMRIRNNFFLKSGKSVATLSCVSWRIWILPVRFADPCKYFATLEDGRSRCQRGIYYMNKFLKAFFSWFGCRVGLSRSGSNKLMVLP